MAEINIKGDEIDLNLGDGHHHPDIEADMDAMYLCYIFGEWFLGKFYKQWYGLSFDGWYNTIQYDKPGTNSSSWKRVIKLPKSF